MHAKVEDLDTTQLLLLEKQRRGVNAHQLVFAGLHNVAQHWWCAEYALQKSWQNEDMFFGVYLRSRQEAAIKLGLIKTIPEDPAGLLELCASLDHSHAERLLGPQPLRAPSVREPLPFDPDIYEGRPPKNHYERGERAQAEHAEQYTSMIWSWHWEDLVLIGQPDGITDDFVYEFKTAGKAFFARQARPVARTQGDLYGYFWSRMEKRIDVLILDEQVRNVSQDAVDRSRAEDTLRKFLAGVKGKKPIAPRPYKCKNCEYQKPCRLSPSNAGQQGWVTERSKNPP